MSRNVSTKEEKTRRRMTWIYVIALAALAVVVLRLFGILIFHGEKYTRSAKSQTESSVVTLQAKRGDITDRNNVTLATSTQTYNLILDPAVILSDETRYLSDTVDAICTCFPFEKSDIVERIRSNEKSHYVVLMRKLPYSDVEGFLAMKEENRNIVGIWLEKNFTRNYTFGSLASAVIGFTDNGRGTYGLEYMYDEELTGTDGREYSYINSENVVESVRKEAEDGNTIKTTIDYNIQSIVEAKIQEFMEENESKTVAVMIQDPNTGEILAMADSDTFDCNNPRDLSGRFSEEELDAMSDAEVTAELSEVWKNFCITQSYEPGSVFKPFTVSCALEEDITDLDSQYYCPGSKQVYEELIHCHYIEGHETITTRMAIAKSCNVALMNMAEDMGVKTFVKYQEKFGFGKYTGIDLPNEMSCLPLLYKEDNMSPVDLAINSFGENFNVTMVQVSSAFCSLINGGYYYKPFIVDKIYNAGGELVKSVDKTLVSRTISQETSDQIKEAMRYTVTTGTGKDAAVDGYIIAGKTGTSEKPEDDKYVVSFIGFAPFDNPQVVCYVVIDEPSSGDESGVSTGFWASIMEEVLPYMNITPASEDTDVSIY